MKTVLIIGAGASGMMAAISARRCGYRVILLEKQQRVGRKLLATGNGRCNLTNEYIAEECYFGKDAAFANGILKRFSREKTIKLFLEMGLVVTAEEGGRIYPNSLQASSVLDALRFEMERQGVELYTECETVYVKKRSGKFACATNKGFFEADKLIIACGGAASPSLGGCNDGYEFLKSFGHSISELKPALTQVKTDNTYPKSLKGIKTDAAVRLQGAKGILSEAFGEVLFTDYGLSGPAIFEISRSVSMNSGKKWVTLDFAPQYDEKSIAKFLAAQPNKTGENYLGGILNKRIGQCVLRSMGYKLSEEIEGQEERLKIAHAIKNFALEVLGTTGLQNAQVTAGGALTAEFDGNTLESLFCPGLFACGEVLDIDGKCGGYNLQWAWSSGFIAGRCGE